MKPPFITSDVSIWGGIFHFLLMWNNKSFQGPAAANTSVLKGKFNVLYNIIGSSYRVNVEVTQHCGRFNDPDSSNVPHPMSKASFPLHSL